MLKLVYFAIKYLIKTKNFNKSKVKITCIIIYKTTIFHITRSKLIGVYKRNCLKKIYKTSFFEL